MKEVKDVQSLTELSHVVQVGEDAVYMSPGQFDHSRRVYARICPAVHSKDMSGTSTDARSASNNHQVYARRTGRFPPGVYADDSPKILADTARSSDFTYSNDSSEDFIFCVLGSGER